MRQLETRSDRSSDVAGSAGPDWLAELQPAFEELGLNGYQARVLLALLQAGSATAIRLGELSGVPRTSVYPVLKELASRGLATQVAGRSSSWASLGVDVVLDRLRTAHRLRVASLDARLDSAQELLSRYAARSEASLPFVQVIHTAAQSRQAFEQALRATEHELLMFTRSPWSWPKEGAGNVTVIGALGRGVRAKALYAAADLAGSEAARSRLELERYHAAGTEARVVNALAMKLAVFDRKVALFTLDDPTTPTGTGFPTSLLVEQPAYAQLQAVAFETLFATALPYEDFQAGAELT